MSLVYLPEGLDKDKDSRYEERDVHERAREGKGSREVEQPAGKDEQGPREDQ